MKKTKQTIKEMREKVKMTQKQFSEELNIPIRTIQSWEAKEKQKRECPEYVKNLIYNYLFKDDPC